MKILVLGAAGLLGSELVRDWRARGAEVIGAARRDADITDLAALERLFAEQRPGLAINAAAYTRVEEAERSPLDALRVNAAGPRNLARAAAAREVPVIQISTDYVFDGSKGTPYVEGDQPGSGPEDAPALNTYGSSKLIGEAMVQITQPRSMVVRLSALFGPGGRNFVETMLRLAGEGRAIRVVDDQFTSPTLTTDVAGALWPLAMAGAEGVVHLASEGECSWHGFACAIFEEAGLHPEVIPVSTEEFGAAARRPPYSVLRSQRVPPLPHWRDALRRYLDARPG